MLLTKKQATHHCIFGMDKTKLNKQLNKEEQMVVETSRNHHPPSRHMESPREEAKRKATEHLAEAQNQPKEMGHMRGEMEEMATNRQQWRSFVDGLSACVCWLRLQADNTKLRNGTDNIMG